MNNAPTGMSMSGQMMWGIGLVGLLVPGIAALIKDLFVDTRRQDDHA